MSDQPKAYSVTALTRMIKTNLEESFSNLWIEGEISDYHYHTRSGHRYLTLKDDNATIRVTMWRSVGQSLKFEPENGSKVLIQGSVSVYEKGGQYQLNAKKIVPVGIGELELAFRQLHEKLTAEGLFDIDRKKPIPGYAKKIGLVTSPSGAAVKDMIRTARRRNNSVELIIFPSVVQGDGAEDTIAAGIEYFNSRSDIDIIITGRGGGSLEDIWCFNTEKVVRAIDTSNIPIITGIGHEIDTTLADLAADLRASTPTAAAEQAVWSKDDFIDTVQDNIARQTALLQNLTGSAREYLSSLLSRPVFIKPLDIIRQRQQHLDDTVRLLSASGKKCFDLSKNNLSLIFSRLDALSPLKVLSRGYSVTNNQTEKKLVKTINDVSLNDELETLLTDGTIISKISKINKRTLK